MLPLRFIKEPVQEEAIMMVLCSIAEERKKRAKKKGARFWAFFVGLFRAQSKETVGKCKLRGGRPGSRASYKQPLTPQRPHGRVTRVRCFELRLLL